MPALALAVVVDVSVALTVGLLACLGLRRRPAALRHWVLAAAMALGASAPLLEVALPRLELPILKASRAATMSGPAFSDLVPTAASVVVQENSPASAPSRSLPSYGPSDVRHCWSACLRVLPG
jgi:hypothetical protein